MGWPYLEGVLPPTLWQAVEHTVTRDLNYIVNFITAQRLLLAGFAILHIVRRRGADCPGSIFARRFAV